MFHKIAIIMSIFVLCMLGYSLAVIYQASSYRDEVVTNDLKNGVWRIYEGRERKLEVKVEDIAQYRIDWLLAIQDPAFYHHDGIDLSTPGAGLTTVTQSIVKKLYFKQFKPGLRKYRQSLIARFVVNEYITKEEQLEIFINSVYMDSVEGEEIYGFSQSSRVYFDKEFSQISDDEYLSLVAMLIGPSQFNVMTKSQANSDRVKRIKSVISGEYQPKELNDLYYNRT